MAAGMVPISTGATMATGDGLKARKSLGQHWLVDNESLESIIELANISKSDTVLEIGPGTGNLTKLLTKAANKVVGVELDNRLANHLKALNISNLEIINQNILEFNPDNLGTYKVVANIPYYLSGQLIKYISELNNRPTLAVLLVQKEIAERLAALPGQLSILGLTCQYYWQVEKGPVILADKFSPPPKVNSQIVKLTPKDTFLTKDKEQDLFKLIKIGFSEKRKTLANNLSRGYRLDKLAARRLIESLNLRSDCRPQTLSLDDWLKLIDLL